jgi:hypothetical protein
MRIGLFIPCFVDALLPEIGLATLELLERFGHEVVYPRDQTYCRQPMADNSFNADGGEGLLGGDPLDVAKARDRAARTLPAIAGFALGCGLGAAGEAALGLWSLALPAGLALLAFALGCSAKLDDRQHG